MVSMNMYNKKGQMWISVIIYTLVAVLALVLILNTGLPILNEMKDRAVFSKVKDAMLSLDSQITDVASQGEGSQAIVNLEIRDGQAFIENNQFIWEIDTTNEIVSPRTSSQIGNLIISSNANVKTYETDYDFIMETTIDSDNFSVRINKVGDSSNWVSYNTNEIIEYISHNGDKMNSNFTFNLNANSSSGTGTGYTYMIPEGNNTNLGRAKVIAHMNSTFAEYDIEFTLNSYSDFLSVRIKNFEEK